MVLADQSRTSTTKKPYPRSTQRGLVIHQDFASAPLLARGARAVCVGLVAWTAADLQLATNVLTMV